MYCKQELLDNFVDRMKNLADILVPYNYPKVPFPIFDDELLPFRSDIIVVDGYSVVIHFQKSDYDDYFMEVLQIYGESVPFLPFAVVSKIARQFLGSHELSLVEVFKESRKIYCWTVYCDKSGRPLPPPIEVEAEICHFNDLKYTLVQPSQVFFF